MKDWLNSRIAVLTTPLGAGISGGSFIWNFVSKNDRLMWEKGIELLLIIILVFVINNPDDK